MLGPQKFTLVFLQRLILEKDQTHDAEFVIRGHDWGAAPDPTGATPGSPTLMLSLGPGPLLPLDSCARMGPSRPCTLEPQLHELGQWVLHLGGGGLAHQGPTCA